MTFYLLEGAYSTAALKALAANPQDRVAPVAAMMEKAGGKLHHFFYAFGETDMVCLVELPDDTDAMAVALTVATAGHMTSYKTRRLISPAEAMVAMQKAQSNSLKTPS
jgi:uncharacterized protein with GYD domain